MKSILIVDDLKENFISIKAVINTNIPNYKVFNAFSGKKGVKLAKEEQPDTILRDIIMPEMNGYEATRQIREFNKDVIIIDNNCILFTRSYGRSN